MTSNLYDNIPVGYYDKIYFKKNNIRSFWHFLKFWYVKKYIPNNSTHLDYACGPGTFSTFFKNGKYYGVDIAISQINYANQKYKSKRHKFIKIKAKNILPFRNNFFHTISMIEFIEHIAEKDLKYILLEVQRVLKPGGKLIVTTPNYFSVWLILEFFLNFISSVKYSLQHINKFNYYKLKIFFQKNQFKVKKIESFLFFSPFLKSLKALRFEQKIKFPKFLLLGIFTK